MNPGDGVYPCVLLAAGASSRMGRQKLLLPLGGETVIRHVAENILQVARPLVVVTGREGAGISSALCGLSDVIIADNPRWREGMVSSAQTGIGSLLRICPDCPGFFLHHADKPFVLPDVFQALAARASGDARQVALIASRHGVAGHPVYFPSGYIPALMAIAGGERLKSVIDQLGGIQVECGSDAVLEDIDRPDDYRILAAKYGFACPD